MGVQALCYTDPQNFSALSQLEKMDGGREGKTQEELWEKKNSDWMRNIKEGDTACWTNVEIGR